MDLSTEDSLRLNVLLNQDLQALRIDESKMIVYGLSDRGEGKVQLNPNCRDEQYLKKIKEVISSYILGSPGGYPIYLRRWTRMGQARDQSLDRLLKLGEPEAVVAVVHAQGLTDELARRAWWAMPNSANARCMLQRKNVVNGEMGKMLADFLIEFLPFEEEPKDMIESVRLVLQPGLISNDAQLDLWSKGQRKNVYLVGFLKTLPDAIPKAVTAHPRWSEVNRKIGLLADNNPVAAQLLRTLSDRGQAFMHTAATVLKKPANQDVVVAWMEAMQTYFSTVRPGMDNLQKTDAIIGKSCSVCEGEGDYLYSLELEKVLQAIPKHRKHVEAMLSLSQLGVHIVNPVFARTDAMGTVMRRKLEPITTAMLEQMAQLLDKDN